MSGHFKISHSEVKIALRVTGVAQGRDEYTRREPATFHLICAGGFTVAQNTMPLWLN